MKKQIVYLGVAAIIGLSGCGNGIGKEKNDVNTDLASQQSENIHNREGTNHSGSGEVPKGLEVTENPTYKVGSKAIITSDHMAGMNRAETTIMGAYDTTVYTVTYTPTTGGEKVKNHKWVIHEELKNYGKEPFKAGDEVTLAADHMEGMNGATASIDSAEQTTVYMVDFTSTDGEKVTNHKWVTESELQDIKQFVNDYSEDHIKDQSASITSTQLIVKNSDNSQITYDLPEDEFFVSIAPYYKQTHPCATHSLTGCRGELSAEEFDVNIIDTDGKVILNESLKSNSHGFIDLWLPRDKEYNITITKDGKTAESKVSTYESDDTCITTMQLK